jgi:hypothetical protein
MSEQKNISTRNPKLAKNITSLLKKTVHTTIEHLDGTSGLPGGPKYDTDLYQSSIESASKLTAKPVNKYTPDPMSPTGKSIVSGPVPRKQIVTFRQEVKWYLGEMFAKYAQEVQAGIIQARNEQLSVKPNDLIETLLTLAANEDKTEDRVYKYLPIILTIYSQFVLNAKDDTLLTYLKKDIASCIPDLMGLVTEKHDIFLNYGEAQNTMIQSYLYVIALFAMETSTRTWVEAVPPEQKIAIALAKSLLPDKPTAKKNNKTTVEKVDESTKMIPCKTVGLGTFKYFMLIKLQTFFNLTTTEYQFFMLTPDQIIEELNADISKEKADRAIKKLEDATNSAARASDSKQKAAVVSARNDTDEETHDPEDEEDEEEEVPVEAVVSKPPTIKRIAVSKAKK